jgi:hypothetical protein
MNGAPRAAGSNHPVIVRSHPGIRQCKKSAAMKVLGEKPSL